jgi:hypothetical protein
MQLPLREVPNMIRCGRLPGLLGLHRRQRVRCTRKISPAFGIVQETTGEVVGFSFNENEDASWVDNPQHPAWERGWVLLEYLPRGVHVRIDQDKDEAAVEYVPSEEPGIWTFTPEAGQSDKIMLDGQQYNFTRAMTPLFSADDGTTQSNQGATKNCVTADRTYNEPKTTTKAKTRVREPDHAEEDNDTVARARYWSRAYVKVSRVKRMERLLLLGGLPELNNRDNRRNTG